MICVSRVHGRRRVRALRRRRRPKVRVVPLAPALPVGDAPVARRRPLRARRRRPARRRRTSTRWSGRGARCARRASSTGSCSPGATSARARGCEGSPAPSRWSCPGTSTTPRLDALLRGADAARAPVRSTRASGWSSLEAMARGVPGRAGPARRRCRRPAATRPPTSTRSTPARLAARDPRGRCPTRRDARSWRRGAASARRGSLGRATARGHRGGLPRAAVMRDPILVALVDEAAAARALAARGGGRSGADESSWSTTRAPTTPRRVAGAQRAPGRAPGASGASYAAAMNAGIGACGGDAVAAAQRRLRSWRPDSCAPRWPHSPRPAWARSRRASYARWARSPTAHGAARRGRHGRRPAAQERPGRPRHPAPPVVASAAEVFGADGAAALYRRETLEDCAVGRRGVRRGHRALWASDADLAWRARVLGLALRLRARRARARTSAPTAPRPARPMSLSRPAPAVPQPLSDDGQERLGAGAGPRPAAGGRSTRSLALGHVLLRERELLGAYAEAWRRLPAARRRRRDIQARRRTRRVPFGLEAAPR